MIFSGRYLYMSLVITGLIACNNNADRKAEESDSTAVADSLAMGSDSLVYEDCYEEFFKGLPKPKDSATVLLTLKSGNLVKLKDFLATDLASKYARYGLKSIDGDAVPELIMYNYTGGAHCCDEVYVFAKDKSGYEYKAKLFGGFACVDPVTNVFTYSLNETLGYFFTCYACSFTDSTKGFKTLREIELRYNGQQFEVKRYDEEKSKQLSRNLEILKEHGYEEIQDGQMDSGWRKEFAMNFAVWHFNNGKDWDATKAVFDKYYDFKDSAKVWKEFYSLVKEVEGI